LPSIESVARQSLKEYSQYVTRSRVLPHLDVKPVHRRILWALLRMGARTNKGQFRKCASIVGETLKFHPHGDKSVYDALCTLVHTPNALITGRGNFGSIYADPAAAARYTEARTSAIFENIFDESMLHIGNFTESYDQQDKEPVLIQTKIPLAPLIGVSGIGVGLTTNLPAFSVDYVINRVKFELTKMNEVLPEYAYGGSLVNTRVFPITSIKKLDGLEYLHIKGLAVGTNIGIINSNPLLQEMLSAKVIDILDESTVDEVSILVRAPVHIQMMILNSCSRPIIDDFKYYWKKLKRDGFYKDWTEERLAYLTRKNYYEQSIHWKDSLMRMALTILSNDKHVAEEAPRVVNDIFDPRIKEVPEEAMEFIGTKEEFLSKLLSKPISAVKESSYEEPFIVRVTKDKAIELMFEDLETIDVSLFSKPSSGGNVNTAKYDSPFKRHIALRTTGIEVRFFPIARVINWYTEKDIIVLYTDGSSEVLDQYFYGPKESTDVKRVAGFTYSGEDTVVVTESRKLQVLNRLGHMKEPIFSAFPAKKIQVDGKEYEVQRGLYFDKIVSWKVLAT